jgi:hypothetical protein
MEDLFYQRSRSIAKDKNSELRVGIKPHIKTTVDKKLVVPIFIIINSA